MSDGKTWANYLNTQPSIEGAIVQTKNINSDGHISNIGTEVSKIYGSNGLTSAISYAATSAISGSVTGLSYTPTLNALYRIQGLDWNDYISYNSTLTVNTDSSNPYASAQALAQSIMLNDSNIHGYEVSYKEVAGVTTSDLSVKFRVYEKKPISEVPKEKRIPKRIDRFLTDVKQQEQVTATAHGATLNTASGQDILTGDSTNSGTLGIIMVNTATGKLVATTASHVIGGGSTFTDGVDPVPGSINKNTAEGITPWDNNGITRGTTDRVSIHKNSNSFHKVDLATLSISDLDKATPFVRTGGSGGSYLLDNGPVEWALPSEVTVDMTVYRKRLGGAYENGTISSISSSVYVSYSNATILFANLITIVGVNAPGDSGCPVFVEINGRKKYIGNHFAGNSGGGVFFVCPCWYHTDPIEGIPVKPWNGDLILSKRTTSTLNMFGRVYEFIGYTTLPVTHSNAIID